MKVLVTGGLGFIGTNFIKTFLLKQPEYKILNLDNEGAFLAWGLNPENVNHMLDTLLENM